MISEPVIHHFNGLNGWRVHEVESVKGWTYPAHKHVGFGDLALVCEGEITNIVNGHETVLGSGTLSWTREKDLHEMTGQRFRFLNLNVSDERIEVLALALGVGKEFAALRSQSAAPAVQLGKRARHLQDLWNRLLITPTGPKADVRVSEFTMLALMALVEPLLGERDERPRAPDWLEAGLQHIEQYIEDGVTVSELSGICEKSPEHISRSFMKFLGMSPSAWINQQRITRASLLLANTNRDILDICHSVGFQSPSYFYRVFRQTTGLAPGKYRKTHRILMP